MTDKKAKLLTCILCGNEPAFNGGLVCKECTRQITASKEVYALYKERLKEKRILLNQYRSSNLTKHNSKACRRAEKILTEIATFFNLKIQREKVFKPFIVDFYLPELRVAIEIDGGVHESQFSYDNERDDWLRNIYKLPVYRFTNEDTKSEYFKDAMWEIYASHANQTFLNQYGYEIRKIGRH